MSTLLSLDFFYRFLFRARESLRDYVCAVSMLNKVFNQNREEMSNKKSNLEHV